METRANALLVGVGILLLLGGLVSFTLWMGRSGWSQAKNYYTIYIERSVTGLMEESVVNYQGVPVGIVKKIRLSPDMHAVQITIALKNNIKLREGVTASLEFQGLTGALSVRLQGGDPGAPFLKTSGRKPYPLIPFEPSSFDNVVTSIPEVMQKLSQLLDEAKPFLNLQNRESFAQILKNVEKISLSFEEGIKPLNKLLLQAVETTQNFEKTSQAWAGLAQDVREIVHENRKNIQEFTAVSLPKVLNLLQESHDIIHSFSQAAEKFSRNPLRFLKGEEQEGYVLE